MQDYQLRRLRDQSRFIEEAQKGGFLNGLVYVGGSEIKLYLNTFPIVRSTCNRVTTTSATTTNNTTTTATTADTSISTFVFGFGLVIAFTFIASLISSKVISQNYFYNSVKRLRYYSNYLQG